MLSLLKKIIIKLLISSVLLMNMALAHVQELCPADPTTFKRIVGNTTNISLYEIFSTQCIQKIKSYYVNRDPDWIAITPLLERYISTTSLMQNSLFKDPIDTLKTINQSEYLSENLGFICDSGMVVGSVMVPERIPEIHNTLDKLQQLKNLSTPINKLRQGCIQYLQKEELRITGKGQDCPKTPEGMADLIKEDNGVSLILDSEYCVNDLFDSIRMGDSKWLVLAPVLLEAPRTEVMTDLSHRFQDALIHALPRNPEGTLRIIAQYFPNKINEVCHTETINADYDPLYDKDGYNSSWNMDLPSAIRGLNALKIKDEKLERARDQCVAQLEYTLKTADHEIVDRDDE